MRITINDVAKYAGVSIKTVSRVINNESSVRDTTQSRVLEAVNALNYKPNPAARNLAGTKSYTIAFIYDNPNAYYVIDMQNGILAECREQGYELLIHPCNSKSKNICAEITSLIKHSEVAGLILAPPLSEMPELFKALSKLDVHFVRILSGSVAPDKLSPSIVINDHYAAYSITQHLIDLGHQNIAFLSGDNDHQSSHERLKGYKAALKTNKIKIKQSLIIDGKYSFESGVMGAKRLLIRKNIPTAIFACNDEIAAGALFTARLMGIAIPKQLSIAGFEDSPFSRQTWPKLTTAQQPTNTIARQAASLLIHDLRFFSMSVETNTSGQENRFNPKLVVRDSTGIAPA